MRVERVWILLALLLLIGSCHAASTEYLEPKWAVDGNEKISVAIIGEVTNDAYPDVLAGSDAGMLYLLDNTGNLKWSYEASKDSREDYPVENIIVADVDGDLRNDVVVTSGSFIYAFQNLEKSWDYESSEYIHAVAVGDFNKDRKSEIVMGTGSYSKGTGQVTMLSDQGVPSWSFPTNAPVYECFIADVDFDYNDEIVAMTRWRVTMNEAHTSIYVISREGVLMFQKNVSGWANDLSIYDLDSDGNKEMVLGTKEGWLYVLDDVGETVWETLVDGSAAGVTKILATDFGAGRDGEIVVGSPPNVILYEGDGTEAWRFPINNSVYSLAADDLDRDGRKEIIVGSHIQTYILTDAGDLRWSVSAPMAEADALSVATGDLDYDHYGDIVLGYGWRAGHINFVRNMGKVYVFEVNKDFDVFATEKEVERMLAEASEKLNLSRDSIDSGMYGEAITLAGEAQRLFNSSGDGEGAQEAQLLVEKGYDLKGAEENLAGAEDHYESGDYFEAILMAKLAKDTFSAYSIAEKTDKAHEIMEKSQNIELAKTYLERAQESFSIANYTDARRMAREAERLFLSGGLEGEAAAAVEVMKKADEEIQKGVEDDEPEQEGDGGEGEQSEIEVMDPDIAYAVISFVMLFFIFLLIRALRVGVKD